MSSNDTMNEFLRKRTRSGPAPTLKGKDALDYLRTHGGRTPTADDVLDGARARHDSAREKYDAADDALGAAEVAARGKPDPNESPELTAARIRAQVAREELESLQQQGASSDGTE